MSIANKSSNTEFSLSKAFFGVGTDLPGPERGLAAHGSDYFGAVISHLVQGAGHYTGNNHKVLKAAISYAVPTGIEIVGDFLNSINSGKSWSGFLVPSLAHSIVAIAATIAASTDVFGNSSNTFWTQGSPRYIVPGVSAVLHSAIAVTNKLCSSSTMNGLDGWRGKVANQMDVVIPTKFSDHKSVQNFLEQHNMSLKTAPGSLNRDFSPLEVEEARKVAAVDEWISHKNTEKLCAMVAGEFSHSLQNALHAWVQPAHGPIDFWKGVAFPAGSGLLVDLAANAILDLAFCNPYNS